MADVANCINVRISQNNPSGLTRASNPPPYKDFFIQAAFVNLPLSHDVNRPGWDWTTLINDLTIGVHFSLGSPVSFQWNVSYGGDQIHDVDNQGITWCLTLESSGQLDWPPGNPTKIEGLFARICYDNHTAGGEVTLNRNVLFPPDDCDAFFQNCHDAILTIRWPTQIGRC
jgi:hypothetical protein